SWCGSGVVPRQELEIQAPWRLVGGTGGHATISALCNPGMGDGQHSEEITAMHHYNRTPDLKTTKPHLASTRSKLRQEDQRLAGEQAMRAYKSAEIEQERKTEKLR